MKTEHEIRAEECEAIIWLIKDRATVNDAIKWIKLRQKSFESGTAARLDADRTAKPLTRLVGHVEAGKRCVGVNADAIEDIATGKRTIL